MALSRIRAAAERLAGKVAGKVRRRVARVTAVVLTGTMLASACPQPAYAFQYHDNHIQITDADKNYDIMGGNFRIWDFAISEGQDPEGYYYEGKDEPLQQEDKDVYYFAFQVGRHATQETAKRWNERFDKTNAIRGSAYDMNFFFFGRMTMKIRDVKTNEMFDLTFDQIGMGQQHTSSGSNDWYFGQVGGIFHDWICVDIQGAARSTSGGTQNVSARVYLWSSGDGGTSTYRFLIDSFRIG